MSKLPTHVPQLSLDEKAQLSAALTETSKSLARAQGEKEYVRESIKKVSTDLKMPKKVGGKTCKSPFQAEF